MTSPKIAPLVDDRDGNVAAAAAEGLGFAHAKARSRRCRSSPGDQVPVIATAAIDSLASFWNRMRWRESRRRSPSRPASDGDQAATAAGALLELRGETPRHEGVCSARPR